MKMVVNCCFGGFGVSNKVVEALHLDSPYSIERTDPRLIELVEGLGSKYCSGFCSELGIAIIPDEATDYRLEEYDGLESVIYVLDGRIYDAEIVEDDEDDEDDDEYDED